VPEQLPKHYGNSKLGYEHPKFRIAPFQAKLTNKKRKRVTNTKKKNEDQQKKSPWGNASN
jgi:hypothetical protein